MKQAHGLANACLARDPSREDIKRRIYDLESHWYNGSHPKTYTEHQQRIADHKSKLTELRDQTERDLDILEPMQASLSTDTLFSRENILKLLNFSNEVFKMSSDCTANLVNLSRSIILSSMDSLVEPPCSFAVIGLDSIARGEATPYSDLEYGFLVESGFSNHEYFNDLAVESYFCIGNLGESPLKCFNIEELNVQDEKGEKLFLDRPPVNGFKIDGISPKAGNIPTGHGREGGKRSFIQRY